jgi:GDP-4-dehydro-6-deoxy-D-mannose reductase
LKALVTGASGFLGRWLVEHLEQAGDEVWRAVGPSGASSGRITAIDVRDGKAVHSLIGDVHPDVIYHLAGISFDPEASAEPVHATMVTVAGTINVLEAAAQLPSPPIVHIPSSGAVYAPSNNRRPVIESHPLGPRSPYGATKMAQEAFGYGYRSRVPVYITRSFNHIGPGQNASFAVSSFAAQLAEISMGHSEPVLHVGNLQVERDFTDARDAVRAFRSVVVGGVQGPVNVASGSPVSMELVLKQLIDLSGIPVVVSRDPLRTRTSEVKFLGGDRSLLTNTTGWSPRIALETSIADIWREAIERARAGVSAPR